MSIRRPLCIIISKMLHLPSVNLTFVEKFVSIVADNVVECRTVIVGSYIHAMTYIPSYLQGIIFAIPQKTTNTFCDKTSKPWQKGGKICQKYAINWLHL